MCSPMNMDGFQMIVQSSYSSEVHKLHVNQSMDLQTPVTVEVEENRVYQVTIFENIGILDSNATHVEYVKSIPITISTCTTTTPGACVHACVRACVHACVCACVCACVRACMHVCMMIVISLLYMYVVHVRARWYEYTSNYLFK